MENKYSQIMIIRMKTGDESVSPASSLKPKTKKALVYQ